MKEFEFRETRAFCRLCERATTGKAIVIPFRYSGKNAPIVLCTKCVKILNDKANPQIQPSIYGNGDWEPVVRHFRD